MENVIPSFISPQLSSEELILETPLKLGVLASGSGTNFEAIANAINQQQLNATIPLVIYNNPQAKVKNKADALNIESKLLNHREFERREDLDQAIVDQFKSYQVDWVIMAGWMRIVTPVLLEAFPNHVINIHPSLLPSFKGIKAIEQALEAKVKITGCTVHLASLEVDSGAILLQAAVPVLPNDTLETLHKRIQIQEHKIFPLAIALAAKLYP
ncbi:MAG: phosphoribosylglycinamide formyltransferase [Crocosphaera sp.]